MSFVQATRLRKGQLVKHNSDLYRVLELQHMTPGNKRGFVNTKLRNVRSGTLLDHKFRSEDQVERASLDEREMQYLYQDGGDYCFMDTSSFEQIQMSAETLGDSVSYLLPEATIKVAYFENEAVGIDLPATVDLRVEDTAPGIKGATASAQVKPARLETGLIVQVPAFISNDDVIRVNTETGEYQTRVR